MPHISIKKLKNKINYTVSMLHHQKKVTQRGTLAKMYSQLT